MAQRIQQRGGTLADWTIYNPILAEREIVIETDTGKVKIGNGIDYYLDLPYALDPTRNIENLYIQDPADGQVLVYNEATNKWLNSSTTKTNSTVYDDIPSLTLLFENGLI